MNLIFLDGYLQNSELKKTKTEKEYLQFSILCSYKSGEEWEKFYVNCKAWNEKAIERLKGYAKGDLIHISGQLIGGIYEGKKWFNVNVQDVYFGKESKFKDENKIEGLPENLFDDNEIPF
jgi:hypothetical protein